MNVNYGSHYKFDRENKDYISAIATYNKNLLVTKVNGQTLEEPFACSQLFEYIHHSEVSLFEIDCTSQDEDSTADVFPKIEEHEILSFLQISQDKIDTLIEPVKTELDKIKRYLNRELDKTDLPDRSSIAPIGKITKEQALLFLHQLTHEYSLSGALLFENCQTILFQHHGKNHILRYGEQAEYLNYISHIRFDIDHGFFTEEDPKLQEELQKLFHEWYKKDHVGPVIPKESSGFYSKSMSSQPSSEKSDVKEFNHTRSVQPDFSGFSIESFLKLALFSTKKLPLKDETNTLCLTIA